MNDPIEFYYMNRLDMGHDGPEYKLAL
jgi:hypothetical protein